MVATFSNVQVQPSARIFGSFLAFTALSCTAITAEFRPESGSHNRVSVVSVGPKGGVLTAARSTVIDPRKSRWVDLPSDNGRVSSIRWNRSGSHICCSIRGSREAFILKAADLSIVRKIEKVIDASWVGNELITIQEPEEGRYELSWGASRIRVLPELIPTALSTCGRLVLCRERMDNGTLVVRIARLSRRKISLSPSLLKGRHLEQSAEDFIEYAGSKSRILFGITTFTSNESPTPYLFNWTRKKARLVWDHSVYALPNPAITRTGVRGVTWRSTESRLVNHKFFVSKSTVYENPLSTDVIAYSCSLDGSLEAYVIQEGSFTWLHLHAQGKPPVKVLL